MNRLLIQNNVMICLLYPKSFELQAGGKDENLLKERKSANEQAVDS